MGAALDFFNMRYAAIATELTYLTTGLLIRLRVKMHTVWLNCGLLTTTLAAISWLAIPPYGCTLLIPLGARVVQRVGTGLVDRGKP